MMAIFSLNIRTGQLQQFAAASDLGCQVHKVNSQVFFQSNSTYNIKYGISDPHKREMLLHCKSLFFLASILVYNMLKNVTSY